LFAILSPGWIYDCVSDFVFKPIDRAPKKSDLVEDIGKLKNKIKLKER